MVIENKEGVCSTVKVSKDTMKTEKFEIEDAVFLSDEGLLEQAYNKSI